ncbi:hypothetical protein BJ912DRAFT_91812 [Pholiota molesta]|nr:hypothetical protein BJ912DRAFT_91812 [Pholiota molesta]
MSDRVGSLYPAANVLSRWDVSRCSGTIAATSQRSSVHGFSFDRDARIPHAFLFHQVSILFERRFLSNVYLCSPPQSRAFSQISGCLLCILPISAMHTILYGFPAMWDRPHLPDLQVRMPKEHCDNSRLLLSSITRSISLFDFLATRNSFPRICHNFMYMVPLPISTRSSSALAAQSKQCGWP